jgi:plasmid stabilization system protein ParE
LKKAQLREAARDELAHASAWYRERDASVAGEFLAEVRRTLALLERFPRGGARLPKSGDLEIRRLPVQRFPYHIVYLELSDRISVLAIAHDRRRPGYWRA